MPLEVIGKMVLNRNVDNFFAETEQAAFHPGNVVPGIDFTNDPLLQGRLFSYTDTQLSRLGGPNFHELEINRPRCPMRNFQRDGIKRQIVPTGRVAYEPNSLDPAGPRENPDRGFRTFATQNTEDEQGDKLRIRPESFADHYSQARMFFRSMAEPEQRHIISRFRVRAWQSRDDPDPYADARPPDDHRRHAGHGSRDRPWAWRAWPTPSLLRAIQSTWTLSPTLSLIKKAKPTLKGRKVGSAGDGRGRR